MSNPTHKAVATPGPRLPLILISVPTPSPQTGELIVRVAWTASTPFDLHQADGGLLVTPPQVMGGGAAGTVVAVGEGVSKFKVGDEVFGYTWRGQRERAHQKFIVAPENLFAHIPQGFSMESIVTVPNNLVTVFHTITANLHLELPWPKPANYVPADAEAPILVWGGASSVGQYALQVLRYWGYKTLIATASPRNFAMLEELGAVGVVDYRAPKVWDEILKKVGGKNVKYVIDCIGSLEGSVKPIAQIAKEESTVAVMLPVIVKHATGEEKPEYDMEVEKIVGWKKGVKATGVRTHFYLENKFLAEHLQPEIMPSLLSSGDVKPNRHRVVKGATLLEKAENALDLLRKQAPSGERLVWRVSE